MHMEQLCGRISFDQFFIRLQLLHNALRFPSLSLSHVFGIDFSLNASRECEIGAFMGTQAKYRNYNLTARVCGPPNLQIEKEKRKKKNRNVVIRAHTQTRSNSAHTHRPLAAAQIDRATTVWRNNFNEHWTFPTTIFGHRNAAAPAMERTCVKYGQSIALQATENNVKVAKRRKFAPN